MVHLVPESPTPIKFNLNWPRPHPSKWVKNPEISVAGGCCNDCKNGQKKLKFLSKTHHYPCYYEHKNE